MAFTLAEAVVFFKGDDSDLEKKTEGAKGKLSDFAGVATKMIGGAVVGAAAAAAGAILAIGKGAFDVSVDTQAAAGNMAASLGLPIEEAERFAEVAKRVYGNNFADSIGDAADAVTQLAKQMGLTADDPALQTMTENAFRLRDVFGVEVNDSVDAVKTLMENFGVSSEEAFNLLSNGYQRGLDRSGDFLDTVGEYSVQFAEGGASAVEFFSALDTGLQGGMLGTDKAADAFKEFRVRIADGSATTKTALEQIGLSSETITAGLTDGSLSVVDAWDMVQRALIETQDPVTQMQAGVGLIGTQFEDLGAKVVLAMDLTEDWAEGGLTSITSLDATYNSFGEAMAGMWRRLTVSVSPFTDKLLELVNGAMPSVMAAFDAFDQNVGPAITNVGNIIDSVVSTVKGLFGELDATVVTSSGMFEFFQVFVEDNMPRIQQIIEKVLTAINTFWTAHGESIMTIVQNTFGTAMEIISLTLRTILNIITLALQLLNGEWGDAWNTILNILEDVWGTIQTVVGNQLDSLRTLFTSIDWAGVGSAIIEGVKSGISTGWRALLDWFPDRLSELRAMLPFSEPKDSSSPLRNLGKSGKALIDNFKSGMDEELANLNASFAGGLAGLAGNLGSQPAAAAGAMNITVQVSGANATYESGRAVGRGIQDELRRRGA